MADRYHVMIIDRDRFSMEDWNKQDKDEYDLYDMWLDPKVESLPDGVWFEEWYVADGESWDNHPMHSHHHLVKEDSYLIDWAELGKFHMIKDDKWWDHTIKTLDTLHKMMNSIYPMANRLLNPLTEILDPDGESIHEAMEGVSDWTDANTLGHWVYLAKEIVWGKPKEDDKDGK